MSQAGVKGVPATLCRLFLDLREGGVMSCGAVASIAGRLLAGEQAAG